MPDVQTPPSNAVPLVPASLSAAELAAPLQRETVKLLREQPALFLSLGYVFLTFVGMVYEWLLFQRFGVNVLDYADVGDFLLAAVREPTVVALCLGR